MQQKQTSNVQKSATIIKKNQNLWNKQLRKADVIHRDGFDSDDGYVGTSMDQLKNHNKAFIKGTVYNLQKMNSPKNMAYTKATIHIDKVLSGDKSLQGKNIYVVFDGGLVSFDHWYANMSKPKDFDHEMLVKNDEFPLPSIGTKIITGLVPNQLDQPLEYNDSLKQSGFTVKNSYALDVPKYNFWVKKTGTEKYILNNPKVRKKTDSLSKDLQKLTVEINQKYNSIKK
ncbi:hypothetical protein IV57_GL002070 [Companilactobacillus kimchiensis]|uniref:Uncharacterized protein n=1 Tax=Companilactobacillus kimchiensis TaxID=993692 RepID=A0A0R2LEF6_9LACO|nr:hypothetical protein IV57_GL002070 [Companilactobacillus kimchiensis]